ncbi:FliA/WhiG family RNA polymerase sigma factor (plasmid) [Pontibacillus sp. ALD_SL1]|uniref:sigma-70 family RNA polymerase sigma factor n=1 Tax=Pontibacillus sp. ALD_SL1 TaxID=2777185 RepID=UPI001A960F37|nr:FliA/WhiG family RNA polymerase sigma factor [Pontibacillus sp. ALD_SL1]QST03054.1 FliA/WhiG family RNA polymerase sigma factor [Pontibacillus sp. ALD_SL1]
MSIKKTNTEELDALWSNYLKTRTVKLRNVLIEHYMDFVNYLVGRVMVIPQGMDREDVKQCGLWGLIKAIEIFDPTSGHKFESYAYKRIMGEIMDQFRYNAKLNGNSRSSLAKRKKIDRVTHELEQLLGRHPTNQELAEALGLGVQEYEKWQATIAMTVPLSLDKMVGMEENLPAMEVITDRETATPEELLKQSERNNLLAKAIDELPEKERLIISLYYYEELTLKEIGRILDLTEGRISQIHTTTMFKLRHQLLESNRG